MSDIDFFKKELAPLLSSFNIKYRNFSEGDLGALEQVLLESQNMGGNFDFWDSGWLGVYIYDYISDSEVCNKLFEPTDEHQEALRDIISNMIS